MIEITKGNPTPDEIAALVAVLMLARSATNRVSQTPRQVNGDDRRRSPKSIPVRPADVTGVGELGLPGGLVSAQRTARVGNGSRGLQTALSPDPHSRTCKAPLTFDADREVVSRVGLLLGNPLARRSGRIGLNAIKASKTGKVYVRSRPTFSP